MPSNARKKCVRCGYTKAWHGRVDGAPDHEFEMPSNKDIVVEARELAPYVQGIADSTGGGKLSYVPEPLRALADEVERLRKDVKAIYDCDKCDLCEDHHANP